MEIELTSVERLTDRLLAASAEHAQAQIRAIREAHDSDVAVFVAAVGARAGLEIPMSARRVSSPDGSVRLVWSDEPVLSSESLPAAEGEPQCD